MEPTSSLSPSLLNITSLLIRIGAKHLGRSPSSLENSDLYVSLFAFFVYCIFL
jgi:hypothetical protein